jgi:FKBP-type peptidyl-prolyl cis-trans isomerase SlyD
MQVAKNTVVSLDIEVSDVWGNLLERSEQPLSYLHGGYAGIVPAVEQALEGKQPGDSLSMRLEPDDAFGDYDEDLVRVEPRARFPETLEVGMQFEGVPSDEDESDDDEAGEPIIYIVTDIADEAVVLDGNHPYAGIALQFNCTVRGVREATAAEIEQGGPDDGDAAIVRVADH